MSEENMLTFDQIENCFGDDWRADEEGRCELTAQQLHEFAHRIVALQESEAGAVDAQNIPLNAIGRMLSEVMETAISNGANSVSMPDHYVEVAAWLSNVKPSAPKYAQAIETAAIMKCVEVCDIPIQGDEPAGFAWTRRHIKAQLLALIPQDGRTQLEEFGMKVAKLVYAEFVKYGQTNDIPKLRAIVTNRIGEKK